MSYSNENMTDICEKNEEICWTVAEFAKQMKIGMNHAYQLVNSNGFPLVRLSERILRIPVADVKVWLSEQSKSGNILIQYMQSTKKTS